MKQMEPPKCRLCEKNHWARTRCDFGSNSPRTPAKAPANQTIAEKVAPGKRKAAPKKKKKVKR